MFIEELELFDMEPGEFVDFMQTIFLHLINKLQNLGKNFSNKDRNKKTIEIYVHGVATKGYR